MAPALLLQGISHLFSSDISSPVIKFTLLYNTEKRKQFPIATQTLCNNSLNKMTIVWAEISQNCSGTQDHFQITLKILLKFIHTHYSCLLTCDNSLHHKPMNFHCHKCISPAHLCTQGWVPSSLPAGQGLLPHTGGCEQSWCTAATPAHPGPFVVQ